MIQRGVIAPILTPFDDDGSVAMDLYIEHAQRLFRQGCAGLAPFGTTGEALSVGIDERIEAVAGLVDAGIDPTRLIPGTGLNSVADTARLSRACLELGCAAVMTLPPFYYKGVSEDGLFTYFARLIDAIGERARIYLYHIPPIAVVGIPPSLTRRLHEAFPAQIVGIKDSSGDWANTRELLAIDGLVVYPGSELPLLEALPLGAPGCISATANLNAASIAKVIERFDAGHKEEAAALHEDVRRFREIIEKHAPIPAQKRLLALASGDERWANVRPPLVSMPEKAGRELAAMLPDLALQGGPPRA